MYGLVICLSKVCYGQRLLSILNQKLRKDCLSKSTSACCCSVCLRQTCSVWVFRAEVISEYQSVCVGTCVWVSQEAAYFETSFESKKKNVFLRSAEHRYYKSCQATHILCWRPCLGKRWSLSFSEAHFSNLTCLFSRLLSSDCLCFSPLPFAL